MTQDALAILGLPLWRRTTDGVRLMAYPATPQRPYGLLITAGRTQGSPGERELVLCVPATWDLDLAAPDRSWWWTLRLLGAVRAAAPPLGTILPGQTPFAAYCPGASVGACLLVEAFAPEELGLGAWDAYAQVLLLTDPERTYGLMCGGMTLFGEFIARAAEVHVIQAQRPTVISAGELPNSTASQPGLIPVSERLLKRMQPELFGQAVLQGPLTRFFGKTPTQQWRTQLRTRAALGLLDAAVVIRLQPLVVAVRSQELDCVALLGFPDELGQMLCAHHALERGTRLSVVNCYFAPGNVEQVDITQGPQARGVWGAFWPLLSIAVCDDRIALKRAQSRLAADDFTAVERLADEYVARKGWLVRSGAPLRAPMPAMPLEQLGTKPVAYRPGAKGRGTKKTNRSVTGEVSSNTVLRWLIWLGFVGLLSLCHLAHGH